MKKNIIVFSLLLVTAAITFNACEKDIPQGVTYTAYTYASKDEDGGTWDPILLTAGSEVIIDAPADVASAEYLAELAEVKDLNSSLSDDQQEIVDYWGNNTLVRWIEIAEELAAKYNLPPDPGPEGNYPPPVAPSGTTPASSDFPFSHPPFTCRMYAYISAAAYDAAISSWHYKYTYNRPALYKTDASIELAYPQNDIPSYPSEDAAIATSIEKMLNALFPNDVTYISEKAKECRDSRMWAGLATQSDLNAGDSIGRHVANVYITRSKNDNAKFAQTNKASYDSLVVIADAMWNDWIIWKNIDIPPRPVGVTPKFGGVTPWWIPDVETVRPGPPPAQGSAEYIAAEKEMLDFTENATKEQERIAFFWSDGPSTYTPAGHWNLLGAEKIVDAAMNPLRTARVFAYLNTAIHDAGISCWDTKYYYFYPRPAQANPEIRTTFMSPNFPSYTSGHSTFSGAGAEVLSHFFPGSAAEFEDFAKEASESRIYARIHWRFDCEVGLDVGHNIGDYAVSAAAVDGGE
ncbi:MAG: phosphatase PAP2 family protein [Fimbriimonadaceae bacterium]|nr:phosphatase PAP2 family protein [Chitinophagales bacterium]